jgi:signal transduction histidine kinase
MTAELLPRTEPIALSIEHQRLLALINSMTDGVIALDADTKVIITNSIALDLLDINALTGRKLAEVVKFVDSSGNAVDLEVIVRKTESPYTARDWTITYDDKSVASLFVSISPVKAAYGSSNHEGWVVIIRDITSEKSVEEERDDFISVTSHELRTPIAITEGNISNALMLAKKTSLDSDLHHSLTAAHDQVLFLANLINDLAMLSRANRGKLALSLEPFDVSALITTLADDYRSQAEAKGLKLEAKLGSDLGQLSSSELYVREILQNFITNALKYTEKGSVTVSAERAEAGIIFSVQDTGIGISKTDQNKLFKKFFRSDDFRVKKQNGTGLGLYVTAKLIKLLNAKMSIESEINVGTKLTMTIPSA